MRRASAGASLGRAFGTHCAWTAADVAVTDRLLLDGFTQVTDENLTIRENGANYEFVLSEGVWNGIDNAGVTGAGTAVLTVRKASVAATSGGVKVDASDIFADVALATADFSSLAGGIEIIGVGFASQASGSQLTVPSLTISARNAVLSGTTIGNSVSARRTTS